ncbi:unnamed protein product [Schistocephalus solidus]|uniref:Uncharacterized protein n=1 Tax=Schistocephalus solidus TaxID=70667 RepID=A0A183SW32_SCHSO|nr:unnamed protein product [Schistocephalus solidus]
MRNAYPTDSSTETSLRVLADKDSKGDATKTPYGPFSRTESYKSNRIAVATAKMAAHKCQAPRLTTQPLNPPTMSLVSATIKRADQARRTSSDPVQKRHYNSTSCLHTHFQTCRKPLDADNNHLHHR